MIEQQHREQLDRLVHIGNTVFGRGNARDLLTCLVVLRLLDIEETRHEEGREGVLHLYGDASPGFSLFPSGEEGERMRWRHIIALPDAELLKHMENAVFPFLRGLGSRLAGRGLGGLRVARFFYADGEHIRELLSILDSLPFGEEPGLDARLYGHLLASLYAREGVMRGPLRPGKALCRAMAALVRPEPGDVVADLNCCFEETFLAVLDYLRNARSNPAPHDDMAEDEADNRAISDVFSADEWAHITTGMFHGFVLDPGNLLPASIHLMLLGIRGETIHYSDVLANAFQEEYPNLCRDAFDCVLTVPNFTRKEQGNAVELLRQIKTKDTTILSILRILQMLKTSGRAAVLVPSLFSFRASYDYTELRKMLIDNNLLEGIVFLPRTMFIQYAPSATCIVIISKKEIRKDIFFYNIQSDESAKRKSEWVDNAFSSMIDAWNHKDTLELQDRAGNVFWVPREEIIQNNYILSWEKYQRKVYDPGVLEDPAQLLASLEKMSQEAAEEIKSIREMFQ